MFFRKKEKVNLDQLQEAFEAQKQTLIQKGYPEMFGKELFHKELEILWSKLKSNADTITYNSFGQIPLLLVVNFPELQKGIESVQGHTELSLSNITTHSDKGILFYALLDVEDGRKMVAKSPKDALKKFEKEQRSALTINESVALLTHYPKLLKNNYLISVGSFYTTKDNESLPLLWLLDEHGNPELHYAWFHIAHGSYGVGSFAIKI